MCDEQYASLLKNVYFCTVVVSMDCAMEQNLKLKKGGTYRERSSPNYSYSTIKEACHNNGVQHKCTTHPSNKTKHPGILWQN